MIEVLKNKQKLLASEAIFLTLQKNMRTKKRNCLFFVHGFNNDFKDVLERAHFFEKNYGVEVVVFTWPANGGGIKGVVSYKSDKREAQLSVNALDRTFEKLSQYFIDHRTSACNQSFSLVMHSMGNYLFKNLMKSSVYGGETLLFDNIIMAAADVNNKDHEEWVDRIAFRKRLYIMINEDDSALLTSRLKFGEKQRARLGHYTRNLNSNSAVYIDFTNAKHVKRSHAYFEDAIKNKNVKDVFQKAFNGERAEKGLLYEAEMNAYSVV
ncbi:hypothetical protein MNBD_GAMMA16-2107 [hydrothermal vent metagenome]|uniref:Alpha/beta hydrolase n=1 Tax=hydrothermal vent metagenome TaxID=652676 RepID=A0A3B0Z7R2_9ZZZZ